MTPGIPQFPTEKLSERIGRKIADRVGSIGESATVTLVIMKLFGLIDWSWLWVLSPVWVPLIIAACILGLISVFKPQKVTDQ